MKLTWYGHSCFLLETAEGSVVFDPYAPGSVPGLTLPPLRADAVLCSHSHRDHGYVQGVTLSGRTPALKTESIPCFHDGRQGAQRGDNRIWIVQAEGRRVAHLGDLGHPLSQEQLDKLGRVDLMLIPVGGYFTIDGDAAWAVKEAVDPLLTVPMHYRGPGFGYEVISPPDSFLSHAPQVRSIDGNILDPVDFSRPAVLLLRCPAA